MRFETTGLLLAFSLLGAAAAASSDSVPSSPPDALTGSTTSGGSLKIRSVLPYQFADIQPRSETYAEMRGELVRRGVTLTSRSHQADWDAAQADFDRDFAASESLLKRDLAANPTGNAEAFRDQHRKRAAELIRIHQEKQEAIKSAESDQ